jgi:hypothetical protein
MNDRVNRRNPNLPNHRRVRPLDHAKPADMSGSMLARN